MLKIWQSEHLGDKSKNELIIFKRILISDF